jgi:hypothetical protein
MIHYDCWFDKIHLALPLALEELILKVTIRLDRAPGRWIKDLLSHKEQLYPSLKRVVLWEEFSSDIKYNQGHIREKEVLDSLGVSAEFEKIAVQFSYKVTDECPSFENDSLDCM